MSSKKIVVVSTVICVMFITMINTNGFAQKSADSVILNRPELWLLPDQIDIVLEKIGESPNTLSTMVSRALLLFRQARYKNEEKYAREAYEYVDEIYQNNIKLKIPGLLVYKGAAYSFIGKVIKKIQPVKKIKLLNAGLNMIDRAIRELAQKNDFFSLGTAYLIRGTTKVGAPGFLKTSGGVVKDLKTAAYYFKKANLDIQTQNELSAYIYSTYADYYLTIGNIIRAKKYVIEGKKIAHSGQLKKYLDYQLQKMN